MQKTARKCDRDSTKKEPEKLETQIMERRTFTSSDRILARETKLCDQSWAFATDYGGRFLRVSSGGKISSSS
jgi:hypothetical protein